MGDFEPSFHHASDTGAERLADPLGDERGHALLVELEDEATVLGHPEGLPLQHQAAHGAGLALHQREARDAGESLGHRCEARIGDVR